MNERKEAVSIFNMSPKIVNKATELLEAIEELTLSEAGLTMKIKQLQAEIAEHRWIPVSERLPEKDVCDDVLFIIEGLVEAGEFKNGLFLDNNGRDSKEEIVTHWKPIILPEDNP